MTTTSSRKADGLSPPVLANILVESKSGEFRFPAATSETLLNAGLAHGLTLPYECGTGTCGTCRARVMSGSVEMAWAEAPGMSRLKREKGDVLMCQARPSADCVLRIPANVAQKDGGTRPERRTAVIDVVQRLTHDVVHIEAALSKPMGFEAGQFVVVEAAGVTGGRAYSMVNFAGAGDRLHLVVKRKPSGKFSDWLFEGHVAGAELSVFGPMGRATFHPDEKRNLLCIAGGSGIAGIMSILEHATKVGHFETHHGHVFFGVRTLADGFYVRELADYVAAANGRLEVTLALSHEAAATSRHPEFPQIQLASGMVHEVTGKAMAGRYDNIIAFVAGPPPLVDGAIRLLVTEARLPSQFIRYDKFS